ncbi:hypothetical protein [Rummeliibacillus stabekisii]|uniref:Uncharacterized protein n=1 Tax=Rummeliibacillus stabekisii TaxID=241244 RepID=A0A143H9R6_9BACL|nr:hypothetical protein [Rummeliibacillus stabekisii]AMW98474.1 hypothetical protein ATY39_02895 [Rummeliibacillus stabekisii]
MFKKCLLAFVLLISSIGVLSTQGKIINANGAAKYKIIHSKLVYAKTEKVVKGYKSYKGKFYKNGILYNGRNNNVCYKKGVKKYDSLQENKDIENFIKHYNFGLVNNTYKDIENKLNDSIVKFQNEKLCNHFVQLHVMSKKVMIDNVVEVQINTNNIKRTVKISSMEFPRKKGETLKIYFNQENKDSYSNELEQYVFESNSIGMKELRRVASSQLPKMNIGDTKKLYKTDLYGSFLSYYYDWITIQKVSSSSFSYEYEVTERTDD